jgi:hypothetical protein
MNQDDLTKLWKWVSLGAFAVVAGVHTIQGGVDVFRDKPFRTLKTTAVKSWRTLR